MSLNLCSYHFFCIFYFLTSFLFSLCFLLINYFWIPLYSHWLADTDGLSTEKNIRHSGIMQGAQYSPLINHHPKVHLYFFTSSPHYLKALSSFVSVWFSWIYFPNCSNLNNVFFACLTLSSAIFTLNLITVFTANSENHLSSIHTIIIISQRPFQS